MKSSFAVTGLVGVLFLAAGYYLGRELARPATAAAVAARSAAEVKAAQGAREKTALEADLRRLKAEMETLAAAAARPAAPVAPAANAAPGPTAPADVRAKALADGRAFLAAFPEAREILRVVGKAQAIRNFAHLARLSGLSPGQVEEIENQTVEFMLSQTTFSATGSLTPASAELPEAQARALLGEEGYRKYLDYRRLMPLVGIVNDLAGLTIREPLTADQATQLVRSLADANSSYQTGALANPQTTDWERVYGEARGFLSPAQLSALQARSQGPRLNQLTRQFLEARDNAP